MTAQTRATLKSVFEDGDRPTGTNYADWIDSMVSIADTTVQSLTSDLQAPKFIATTEVSAPQVNAQEVSASAGNFTVIVVTSIAGTYVNASSISTNFFVATDISAATGTFTGIVSAATMHVTSVLNLNVVATAEASGGSGGKVPASAATFIEITHNGTVYRLPAFNT